MLMIQNEGNDKRNNDNVRNKQMTIVMTELFIKMIRMLIYITVVTVSLVIFSEW